jgi:hypothetical protein
MHAARSSELTQLELIALLSNVEEHLRVVHGGENDSHRMRLEALRRSTTWAIVVLKRHTELCCCITGV